MYYSTVYCTIGLSGITNKHVLGKDDMELRDQPKSKAVVKNVKVIDDTVCYRYAKLGRNSSNMQSGDIQYLY